MLTIVGTIGRTCVMNDNTQYVFQRSVAVLKPHSNIDSFFLMYSLLAKNDTLNKEAQGAAQKGIYLKQLANISISLPPLAEQQAIVSRLDTLSEHCRKLEQNYRDTLTLCDDLKQALLREVFE